MCGHLRRFAFVSPWCIAAIFFGCNEPPAQNKPEARPAAAPGVSPNQAVVETPQAKDAHANPSSEMSDPKDAPKGNDPDRDQRSFTLNPTNVGAVYGNVHLYHVNHLNRPAARDDEPYFVVWTDARGYRSAAGIKVSRGGLNKKADDPPEHSFNVNLTLRYGGKDNEYERETKGSFHMQVLDQKGRVNDGQKGQFQIDGKAYEVAKGTLILVAGQEGDVRVKLLSRPELPRDLKEVIAFGKADADIKAFFPELKTMPYFSEAAKAK